MLGDDPFSNGFAAGFEGRDDCPHRPFSLDWCFWHAGHTAGINAMCTQLEFVMLHFPQD